MDEKKDISNTNHESSKAMGAGEVTVFAGNQHFAFVYRKTEKLVTAVYMITNFIKDNEPLKWQIRERALSLMSLNLSFATVSLRERKELLKEYQTLSVEIVSLSTIASHAGLISEMNWSILKREFETLLETVESDEYRKTREETVVLSPQFFEAGQASSPIVSKVSKDKGVYHLPPTVTAFQGKDTKFFKGHVSTKPTQRSPRLKDSVTDIGSVAEKKGGRREVIISLLRKKGGLSIKDFSGVISSCSEKTIQRELLDLVSDGTLRKEGERRWSKYYLV